MKRILALLWTVILMSLNMPCFAAGNMASTEISYYIAPFTSIIPVTSPVLIANITDKTGNLYAPLVTKFKVITNTPEKKTLYLKSNVVTDGGYEESMFMQDGQVYIAFANLARIPSSQALANCKMGAMPKDSPGIVAYPVRQITGAQYKYLNHKNKYELTVDGGTSYVTVGIGQNVLKNSFSSNDPKGFYQAVLSLTEADI